MPEVTALATMPDPTTHNVLVPQRGVLGRISKFHSVCYNVITIDVDVETYKLQGGGVALHKSALNKIATAAGIRIVKSGPLGAITPDRFVWQVVAEMPLGGEEPVRGIGTKEWAKGIGKDGGDQEHRISKAETKALLRAIRAILGIKTKYDPAELAKPIAVPHILYDPDMSDEGVRMAVAGQRKLAIASLYGPEPDDDDDEESDPEPPEGVDPDTGEIIAEEAEYEIVDDDDPMPLPRGPNGDEFVEELLGLQGRKLTSKSSPFDGLTFAAIFDDEQRGGIRWFENVVEWADGKDHLPEEQRDQVDAIRRFVELTEKTGGQLM